MTLGDRIRYIREKRNILQKQLADALGITNVQLSRYETGDRKPDPDTLKEIAKYLEVSTDYLHGLTNDPNPKNDYGGTAFYGFPDNYTEEELDVARAAIEAYRKMKNKGK